MELRTIFSRIASEYPVARTKIFGGHPLAMFIRGEAVQAMQTHFTDASLSVRGSAGQGQWTDIPWFIVLDKNFTDGPQEGIYVCYLFSQDMQHLYLTLAQGVTHLIETVGRKDAFRRMQTKAADIRANYEISDFADYDGIRLGDSQQAKAYDQSVIYAKKYRTAELPTEQELVSDLQKITAFYRRFLEESDVLTEETDFTAVVGRVEEGKRLLKQHYTRERNPRVIKDAKRLALQQYGELRCEVCGFSFGETYGDRAKDYIEGHHRKAVSEMQPGDTTAVEDIAMLCSNCHRTIHAKFPYISVDELRGMLRPRS
jgi:predicted HNH restriction endonuclease